MLSCSLSCVFVSKTVEQVCVYVCSNETEYMCHKGGLGLRHGWGRVREGDAVEEAGGTALRCSVIFHIALGGMSTPKRILNTIIALRLVLINISLTLVLYFSNLNQNQLQCIAAGMPVRLGPDPGLAAIMMGRWKSQAHSQAALLGGASLWNGEIMETRCAVDAWDTPQSVWELLSVRGRAHYHCWKRTGPQSNSSLHTMHTHVYCTE